MACRDSPGSMALKNLRREEGGNRFDRWNREMAKWLSGGFGMDFMIPKDLEAKNGSQV